MELEIEGWSSEVECRFLEKTLEYTDFRPKFGMVRECKSL